MRLLSLSAYASRCLLVLSLGVGLTACSGAGAPPSIKQRLDTLGRCQPTDLAVLVPWSGPGFDPTTGALRQPLPTGHIEAFVNGWRKYDAEAVALRLLHGERVGTDVFAREGLIGFEGVESDECDLSMSHSLWRDEASLIAFVTGSAHAAAMIEARKMHNVVVGAHWTGEPRATAPTWKQGLDRFIQEAEPTEP